MQTKHELIHLVSSTIQTVGVFVRSRLEYDSISTQILTFVCKDFQVKGKLEVGLL